MLAQIKAPHFCAGIILTGGVVTEAAPIVKYMIGWDRKKVRAYCDKKGWTTFIVSAVDCKSP